MKSAEKKIIKLVVFDLSGTTIQDDNAVAKCLHTAALQFGLNVELTEFQASIGTNKIHLYQYMIARSRGKILSIKDFEKYNLVDVRQEAMLIFNRYTELMLDYYQENALAMPGAEETFHWCHQNGIKVATDTGFHRDINSAIFKKLGWMERGLVDLSVNVEDTEGVGRPSPFMIFHAMKKLNVQSVHEVIKVGDTPADLLSGKNAGCIGNIGVLSGANSVDVLGRYAHTHIIQGVKNLPEIIEAEF